MWCAAGKDNCGRAENWIIITSPEGCDAGKLKKKLTKGPQEGPKGRWMNLLRVAISRINKSGGSLYTGIRGSIMPDEGVLMFSYQRLVCSFCIMSLAT
jgi:hypothetical protein